MDIKKIATMLSELQQLKDELAVQANLGVAEAKEELQKLEPLYEELKAKAQKIAEVAGDTASEIKAAAELGIEAKPSEEIETALELAGDQLKNAYGKIKALFS